MRIKTENGEAHVTSQGQGTLNTVLGAVGTAGALGMLGMGSGLFGRGNRQPQDPGDRPVTRYEMDLIRESIAKDNEIVLLKSQQYTDRAMAGVQEQFGKQIAWNAVQQNNILMLERQLGSITRFVVPESAIGASVIPPVVSRSSDSSAQNAATQNATQG